MDAAEPSSNGISASNLYRLASMLEDEDYRRHARATVQAFEAEVEQFPWCFVSMLSSVVVGRLGCKGVVVTGLRGEASPKKGTEAVEVLKKLRREVGVGRTIVGLGTSTGSWLRDRNPLFKDLDVAKDGVMVCENGVCREGKEFL